MFLLIFPKEIRTPGETKISFFLFLVLRERGRAVNLRFPCLTPRVKDSP